MALQTSATSGVFRKLTALGPIKMEVLNHQKGSDADTWTSDLAHPKFVMAFEEVAGAPTLQCTLDSTESSATFKLITMGAVTGADLAGKYTVLVFGF
jgi:hypothetical protein